MRWQSTHIKLRRFARIDARHRGMLMEATLCLLISRVALVVVPFPRLARRLGRFVPPSEVQPLDSPTDEQIMLAREVGWAVTRAARHVPFKAVCLPQAMAARFMLKRRGVPSVMHFGAAKGTDKPLDAHAWLDAAGVEVTGFPIASQFAEIGCFV